MAQNALNLSEKDKTMLERLMEMLIDPTYHSAAWNWIESWAPHFREENSLARDNCEFLIWAQATIDLERWRRIPTVRIRQWRKSHPETIIRRWEPSRVSHMSRELEKISKSMKLNSNITLLRILPFSVLMPSDLQRFEGLGIKKEDLVHESPEIQLWDGKEWSIGLFANAANDLRSICSIIALSEKPTQKMG